MPVRTTPFANNYFYHIYNRGVEKRKIFNSERDYQRFIKALEYYQFAGPKPRFSYYMQKRFLKLNLGENIVEVVAFCLMPNHFHLLLKQVSENGVQEFVSKLSNSYTKFYNTKYKRVGPLFQGEFKAVMVESEAQLMHLSRYIHLNPHSAHLIKGVTGWEWSSLPEFINNKQGFCVKAEILNLFKSPSQYQQFIQDRADYLESIEVIYPQLLEEID